MQSFKEKARTLNKTIVLPEGNEPRTIKAASIITNEKLARVILLGNEAEIEKAALEQNVDFARLKIIDPSKSEKLDEYAELFYELRKHKGISKEEAKEKIKDEIYFGTMMIKNGDADGLVAGAAHSTGETIRPALQIIKTRPGINIVSGCFIMIVSDKNFGDNGVMIFADCAVNPNPDAAQKDQ